MIHLPPAHERRTHGRYASGKEAGYRWEKMIGQISGRGRSASPTASASTISVWCYKSASRVPFSRRNAMPGDVARASRALAFGNAEQAASWIKSRGPKRGCRPDQIGRAHV